jgi:NAD dependent epimerase/dehydratase family enzyme
LVVSEAGIRVVLIRIPSVLASHGHSLLAAMLPMFKQGLGFALGSGKQLMCFIARDDMIRALQHVTVSEQIVAGGSWLKPEKPLAIADQERANGH